MQKFTRKETDKKFVWDIPKSEYHPYVPKCVIGKISYKVPMQKAVITEDNRLYHYEINKDGGVMFQYVATILEEFI